jgi:Cysteine-rich secretory protein family
VKHFFCLGFFFLVSYNFFGQSAVIMQDKPFVSNQPRDSLLEGLMFKDADYRGLTAFEREIIYWINLLRSDPPAFSRFYLGPFLQQFPELRSSDSRSLDMDLLSIGPLSLLVSSRNLREAAKLQANFLSNTNQLNHSGPKGRTFKQRMVDAGVQECAGENLFDGKADPLVSLLLLLIDRGVEGVGHRKALLNTGFTKVGVGVVIKNGGEAIIVQVFSCN